MSFSGFKPDAMQFFKALRENNNKEWFNEHKGEYEDFAKGPMVQLIAQLVSEFHAAGVPLHAEPAKSIMRVNRDVRFSKDKSPYKTSISATMTRSGERHGQGMMHLHFEPGESFVAAGFYELEPTELAAMRARIVDDPEQWRAVEAALGTNDLALDMDNSLARLPKGFSPDLPEDIASAVRLKSFVTKSVLTDGDLQSPELPKRITGFAQGSLPLLQFGWSALGIEP